MGETRPKQPGSARVFKSKLDDPVSMRGSVIRAGAVILVLLGVVAFTWWITFATEARPYEIKGKHFKVPPECMAALESGRSQNSTDSLVQQLQQSQAKSMTKSKITFVALTTLEDSGRFLLLMSSLRKFLLDAKEVTRLLLIVPENHAFAFQSIDSWHLPVPVEIVGEEKLSYSSQIRSCEEASMFAQLPEKCTKCFSGYSNQMLLKLLVAAYVETEFYLTLDADTLLRTQFKLNAVMYRERATYNKQSYAQGSNWFESSADALQLLNSSVMERARHQDPESLTFGVTPAILSRTISLKTIERLVALYGTEFEVLMHALNVHGGFNSDNFWTEYTLYAIVGQHEQLFSTYHTYMGNGIYAEDVSAVWLKFQAAYWNASLAFSPDLIQADAAPFTVFQSRAGVPVNEIAAHVQPFLTS